MRVLLIEDDPPSRKFLAVGLRREGYAVDTVGSATEALGLTLEHGYDLLIVDVGLPEGATAGLEFVQSRRAEGDHTPALFLSARGELDDRVAGLEAGGDDYLVKPAHLREIVARAEALARRQRRTPDRVLRRGNLEVDWTARAVTLAGQAVHLTAKEYALLALLAGHPGRVFTRDEIIARVWDERFDSDEKLVNVYAKTLRQKLGGDVIQTVRGVGYRFAE
jgi:DNA-binding response OmpR family regulator